jgi:hypothetical protein
MTEQPAAPPSAAGKDAPKPAAPESPQDRADRLREQLAEAEAALPPAPGTVRLRVMPPHDSFTFAGHTVGKDPTAVPVGAVARLLGQAADAGVTIKEA